MSNDADTPQGDDKLWTVDELAAYLQVSKATIYAWNSYNRGGPPRIRVGKYLRYRRADVDAWLDSHVINRDHEWAVPLRRQA